VQSYNYFSDNTTISTFFFITVAFYNNQATISSLLFRTFFTEKKGLLGGRWARPEQQAVTFEK